MLSPLTTSLAIALIAGAIVYALYKAKPDRLSSFCILFFFGNLIIESSIVPLEMVFEHRTYLPSITGIMLVVLLYSRTLKSRKMFQVSLTAVCLLLSFWTFERNKVWQDELTMWADIHKKSPEKARVNQHYGVALSGAGRIDEALPVLEKALYLHQQELKAQQKKQPRLTSFHLQNLGIIYKKKGDFKKAIYYLNSALREFYFSSKVHFHLAQSYEKTWRLDEAIHHYEKALDFARHHSSDLVMQENVQRISMSLQKARKLKRAKEKRQLLLKQKSEN
jgi:tetratricopeptide (TPR) repeat protein